MRPLSPLRPRDRRSSRWISFDPSRNFPDLGPRFVAGERLARGRLLAAQLAALPSSLRPTTPSTSNAPSPTKPEKPGKTPVVGPTAVKREERWGDDERDFDELDWEDERVDEDQRDLSWSAVLKRTFEGYLRGERANMYGEWLDWDERE